MAISQERAQRHVKEHSERLRLNRRNARWPKCLFFTAHLDPACEILISGNLIPRAMQSELIHDVANPGAIASNPRAHHYTRLYFRPKNDYHLKTEGIKCLGDEYRQDKHMSIPIMLVFDSQSLLSYEGVGFTCGNFATITTTPGFDEEYFNNIPFDMVYHDGPLSQERMHKVHYHRMAEVVYRGELPIEPFLRQIICRTPLDRESLLSRLGDEAPTFKERIRVEQIHGSAFMHWGLYIRRLNLHKGTLYFEILFPRKAPVSGYFNVVVRQYRNGQLLVEREENIPANSNTFCITGFSTANNSSWEIVVEEVIAFCGQLPVSESELV